MTNPLISIITVCHNEEDIEKTCHSIINQTFKNFEWIVIDRNSTCDTTLKVLEKYKDKMSMFVSEQDTGLYHAMNSGIKNSKGTWLIFMTAGDCFYNYNVLEDVFYRKKYEGLDVLYGNCCQLFGPYKNILTYPSILTSCFFKTSCINQQSTFIKKSLFEKYGTYDEKYKIISDRLKWLEFLKHRCTFFHIQTIVALFNMENISYNQGEIYQEEMRHLTSFDFIEDNYLDKEYVIISAKHP